MKVAIASGKGGTGKTTLATNLAAYLATRYKVVLIDLDVEEPNSGLFLKGDLVRRNDMFKQIPEWDKDRCILCGNCQKLCNFHAVIKLDKLIMIFSELCHSCYACSELCPVDALPMIPVKMGEMNQFKTAEFNFVESRLDVGQEQAVPLIAQTIEAIDAQFDESFLKIFDSPPGTSCPVIEVSKNSELMILVTEPTPFGLHDLKLAVETMRELNKLFAVVINRYGIGDDKVIEYCRKEGIEILAKIPNDRRIAELYSQGELVYKQFPEFRKQLELIAEHLTLAEK